MKVTYSKFMKELWELTGEIGDYAEGRKDAKYDKVYHYLNMALDAAESEGLIVHEMDGDDFFND